MVSAVRTIPEKLFRPIGKCVALHVFRVEETEGGLVLPDGAGESYRTPVAQVVAIGPEVSQVKEGDKVLVHGSLPTARVCHKGWEYCIVEEKHILGILL